MEKRTYEIYVDPGGTFTDCIGQDPEGNWHRRKVLSSGSLRGVITRWEDSKTLIISENWELEEDIIRGYRFNLINHANETIFIQSFELERKLLRLTRELPPELIGQKISFEIFSGEEAPVFGARLITGTPLDLDLPPIRMKLGSTKGTNALLERKGADLVLFVTKGFRDILDIGDQQRPDIFTLEVIKRKMLYRHVIEVEERIDSKGTILQSLNARKLKKDLMKIRKRGFDSAAICLLNAYSNPVHEFELADILRKHGINDVSVSTELTGLIKYVDRAETATVNAYLNPVFRNYIEYVRSSIPVGR
ncbi:MAG: hypothetical protein KAT15_19160, partial [Bacteroidales bacterium]|nr:hypothetical protein [Bacteroidales bacterium]